MVGRRGPISKARPVGPQTSLAGKSGALLGSPRLGAGLNRGYRAPSSGGLEVCGCSAGAKGQS